VHPSLIAGEDHTEVALEGRNLVVKAMNVTTNQFDTTLAGFLVSRLCINKMSSWCLIGASFGRFKPDIAFFIA
jgi:hypothetical protein